MSLILLLCPASNSSQRDRARSRMCGGKLLQGMEAALYVPTLCSPSRPATGDALPSPTVSSLVPLHQSPAHSPWQYVSQSSGDDKHTTRRWWRVAGGGKLGGWVCGNDLPSSRPPTLTEFRFGSSSSRLDLQTSCLEFASPIPKCYAQIGLISKAIAKIQ